MLPANVARKIEATLAAHEAATSAQVVVTTVSSLQGLDIESYANQLFRAWALGQKDKNNRVLFVVAPSEREMRIEVDYGLESQFTNALTSQIIREMAIPAFKAGNIPGGVEVGTAAILKVLGSGALPVQVQETDDDWESALPFLIFFGIWWGGSGFGGGGSGGFGGGGGSSVADGLRGGGEGVASPFETR